MKRLPPLAITAIVLVAGFAICAMQFPNIASTRVVANLLTDNAFLGIVATGMTFMIISGGIDLSVGSVIGFTCRRNRPRSPRRSILMSRILRSGCPAADG